MFGSFIRDLCRRCYRVNTLPKTDISPENHGVSTIVSLWVSAYFQGRTVRFRESKVHLGPFVLATKILDDPSIYPGPPCESRRCFSFKNMKSLYVARSFVYCMIIKDE